MSTPPAVQAPPYVWMGMALVVGLAVMVWHRYGQDPEDTDWLDPGQPPINARIDFGSTIPGAPWTAPGAPATGRRNAKPYPWKTLLGNPCCWVGDC